MELHVKRNEYRRLEKGKIEFTDVKEWATLSCALKDYLKRTESSLNLFEEQQIIQKKDFSVMIQGFQETISILENMINALDPENELSWKII